MRSCTEPYTRCAQHRHMRYPKAHSDDLISWVTAPCRLVLSWDEEVILRWTVIGLRPLNRPEAPGCILCIYMGLCCISYCGTSGPA